MPTADQLYQQIKQYEAIFPIPAPFVTLNVGTFDASAGTWKGLTKRVTTDPEPIEHGPHQHPTNPPPPGSRRYAPGVARDKELTPR